MASETCTRGIGRRAAVHHSGSSAVCTLHKRVGSLFVSLLHYLWVWEFLGSLQREAEVAQVLELCEKANCQHFSKSQEVGGPFSHVWNIFDDPSD